MGIREVLQERERDEPGITERIDEKLEKLMRPAAGRQATQNFVVEELVTPAEWNTLIDAIRDCADTASVIQATVSRIMSDHKLQGPPAKCPDMIVFGRAVIEADLAKVIHEGKAWATEEWSRRTIRYAKSLDDVGDLQAWLDDVPLGKYVMWATFNEAGLGPFASLPDRADGIRAALGLSKTHARDQPLLLLQYQLEDREARMPRVTEAYAGPMWTHYFRPAGPLERKRGYGRTFPWDEVAEENGAGEPEVVHEPIHGNRLAAPLIEKS